MTGRWTEALRGQSRWTRKTRLPGVDAIRAPGGPERADDISRRVVDFRRCSEVMALYTKPHTSDDSVLLAATVCAKFKECTQETPSTLKSLIRLYFLVNFCQFPEVFA